MAYAINKFNGEQLIVLDDGTIDTSTSLGLIGRNYIGYGETQNENFVFLLENFSNNAPPPRPLTGQCWYNSVNKQLSVYDGTTWRPVGYATRSTAEPELPSDGELWLSGNNQLYVYGNNTWNFIGPESVSGFGTTRAKSTTLLDINNSSYPVILLLVNNATIAICSEVGFTINPSNAIVGFSTLIAGVTLSTSYKIKGNLEGNATTATFLENIRTINGVGFNGGQDITIKAATPAKLSRGNYIVGNDFDGSATTTWSVDATVANTANKIVVRDVAGNFAAGTISANLSGDVSGNVTATTGTSKFNRIEANEFIGPTLSGNADTATRLRTARTINGVLFDGTQNITVNAPAQTLTGTVLSSSVVESSLTKVGTLDSLRIASAGVTIGTNFRLLEENNFGVIRSENDRISLGVKDPTAPGGYAKFDLWSAAGAQSQNLEALSTVNPVGNWNLGNPANKFNKIYATSFIGNATTATSAVTSTNIAGGGAGALPYQSGFGTTTFLPAGIPGQILKVGGAGTLVWQNLIFEALKPGTYLTFKNNSNITVPNYSSQVETTISINATPTNTPDNVVARDSNGDFSARNVTVSRLFGPVTGNVTGNLIGNADTTTKLQTPRLINGVPFDGTADINLNISAASINQPLVRGNYLTGNNYNGAVTTTWAVDATPSNIVNKVVARDANGDFSARNITASLFGTHQGNIQASDSSTAYDATTKTFTGLFSGPLTGSVRGNVIAADSTVAYNASNKTFSGTLAGNLLSSTSIVAYNSLTNTFIGSFNGPLNGAASQNVLKSGDTMSNFLTLHAKPVNALHAATKNYVDDEINSRLTGVRAWVIFDGTEGAVIEAFNVSAVARIATGTYRITINSGVFTNGNYVVSGTAGEQDHFICWESATATQLVIRTVDNAGSNDSTDTTTDRVTVMMVR